jgi:5-methylcytosine-specific restriction protein A
MTMAHNWGTSTRLSRLPKNWRKIRKQVLERDPTCRICGVRPSVIADHIEAMKDDHRLEALQGVCDPCHRRKTAAEAAAARAASPRPTRMRPPEPHPGLRGD